MEAVHAGSDSPHADSWLYQRTNVDSNNVLNLSPRSAFCCFELHVEYRRLLKQQICSVDINSNVTVSLYLYIRCSHNKQPPSVEAGVYLRLATDLGFLYGIAIIQRRIGVGPNHKFLQVALGRGTATRN